MRYGEEREALLGVSMKQTIKKGECGWNFVEKPGDPNKFCGAPTGYTMEKDEDEVPRRKYRSFCPEHQKLVDELGED